MRRYTDDYVFTTGKRYRLVHQAPGLQRVPRESVMVFLNSAGTFDDLQFSARPVAGTQQLPRSWVQFVEEVPDTTMCYVNRRHKPKV